MKQETQQLSVPGRKPGEAALVVRLFEPSSGSGTAPMILYLHGFGSNQWGEKATFFRRSATAAGLGFCSFDFQGHGRSGGSMVDLTLSRNLADVDRVAQLLAGRGHQRHIVLGSSMGGFTALWHAALHPERVLAGLCIAPALSLKSTLRDWAGEDGMKSWREKGTIRVENEIGSWDLGWDFVADLENHPVWRLQQRCRSPFLILQGRLDDRVDWRQVTEFIAGCEFEDLELHLFADGDHRLVDRKDRLWQLMQDYLESKGLLPSGSTP